MIKQISIIKRAIFLMALFIFVSCEKPNEGLGFDTLIGDVSGVDRAEYSITTQTRGQDSILVAINYAEISSSSTLDYSQTKLLGTYVDPLFGLAKAELISEMLLEDLNPQFGTTPIVDSVNLYINITDYYGDTTKPMNWEVHQLAEQLSDTAFYSSFSPTLGTKLGELKNYTPKPNTNFKFEGEDVLPCFKIPLDVTFFQEQVVDQGNTFSSFTSNDEFITYFKGIKISVEASEGSILSLNTNSVNSKILVFFREADTSTTSSQIEINFAQDKTLKPIGFSTFSQDYTSYPVSFNLNDANSEAIYVQPMGGVFGTMDIEMIDTMQNKGYIINRAYLELPVKRPTSAGFLTTTAIEVRELNDDGQIGSLIDDFSLSQGGGTLLSGELRDNKYRLEFTRELFNFLNNEEEETLLPTYAIVPFNKSTSPKRTVLNGGNNTSELPKLIVFYTKPE